MQTLKIKNVARYLQQHAMQLQLAQHLYKQAQNAQHNANYIAFANSNAQAIASKYATKIVANASAFNALIIAQCLHNSNTFASAQADLQYILQAHNLIKSNS